MKRAPKSYSPVLEFFLVQAWALEDRVFEALKAIVDRHVSGERLSREEIDAAIAARPTSADESEETSGVGYQLAGEVAVIPISGVIARHASQVNDISSPRGTSVSAISGALKGALADKKVKSILLDVDSPGGSVDGVPELADEIAAAHQVKPVTALAQGGMCSAAYWLGSQAGQVFATKASAVGSIGVYAAVRDTSRAAKNQGVEVHVVKSAAGKGGGIPGTPVTNGVLEGIQREVDAYHELFVDAVARGRRITPDAAGELADGSVRIGKQAVAKGLIDGISSIDALLTRMNAHRIKPGESTKAAAVAAAHNPEVAVGDTMGNEAKADPVPVAASGGGSTSSSGATAADAIQQERSRVSAILAAAFPGQEAMAAELVATGVSVQDAQAKLIADHKTRFVALQAQHADELKLAKLKSNAPESAGPALPASPKAKAGAATVTDRDKWTAERKAEYAASEKLQAQFGGPDAEDVYLAYCEGKAKGRLSLVSNREREEVG